MSQSSYPIAGAPIAGAGAFVFPSPPPGVQDLLETGGYVLVAEQDFRTVGTSQRHILLMCAMGTGFTTMAADAPPLYEVGPYLTDGISIRRDVVIGENSYLTGSQGGQVSMIIPGLGVTLHTVGEGDVIEPLTLLQRQRQCGGQTFRLKIGQPEYGYGSFHTVFETRAAALEPVGTAKMTLSLRDRGRSLEMAILSTFAGVGGAEGGAEVAGQPKGRHYGAVRNAPLKLIHGAPALVWHATDRAPTVPMGPLYEGGVELEEDSSGYPFADEAAFQAHAIASGAGNTWVQYAGMVRTRTVPAGVLTIDFHDDISVTGIIRAILEEAGVPPEEIVIEPETYAYGADNSRSRDWQDIAQTLLTAPAAHYIAAPDTVISVVEGLAKTHGLSRYQDRAGRVCFAILDCGLHEDAVSGVDYQVIDAADNVVVTPKRLPSTLWPPRFRECVLSGRNWTVMAQDQVLPAAPDGFRQRAGQDGDIQYVPDIQADTSPVLAAIPNAVDPVRLDTAFVDSADAQALGSWFQRRSALTRATGSAFLSARQMFRISVPLSTGFQWPFFQVVKFRHPTYWPDGELDIVGQVLPPDEEWATGMMEFDLYAYGLQYSSVVLGSLPYSDMEVTYLSGISSDGHYVYGVSPLNSQLIAMENDGGTLTVKGEVEDTALFGASDLDVLEGLACVVCPDMALFVTADTSDPAAMTVMGSTAGPVPGVSLAGVNSLSRFGDHVIVTATDSDRAAVIAVGVPAAPTWRAEVQGPEPGVSIAAPRSVTVARHPVTGRNVAYIVCADRLALVDVDDPDDPTWLGELTGLDSPQSVQVAGAWAFVSSPTLRLVWVVDVKDPGAPLISVAFEGPEPLVSLEDASGLLISGTTLYVSCPGASMVVAIDVSVPDVPRVALTIRGPNPPASLAQALDMAAAQGYLYVNCADLAFFGGHLSVVG